MRFLVRVCLFESTTMRSFSKGVPVDLSLFVFPLNNNVFVLVRVCLFDLSLSLFSINNNVCVCVCFGKGVSFLRLDPQTFGFRFGFLSFPTPKRVPKNDTPIETFGVWFF